MPLLRVDYHGWYDKKTAKSPFNMLAGSILFLRPGAVYDVRLTLRDPDLAAPIEQTKRIRTKPWPTFAQPARVRHVVPPDPSGVSGDGSKSNPFRGMIHALAAAQPGDQFLLHAGDYGVATVAVSGSAGDNNSATDRTRYISFKAAGDGPAVFRRLDSRGSHLWFDGLTVQRTTEKVALKAGGPCENIVVRNCMFRDYHDSIVLSRDSTGSHRSRRGHVGRSRRGHV